MTPAMRMRRVAVAMQLRQVGERGTDVDGVGGASGGGGVEDVAELIAGTAGLDAEGQLGARRLGRRVAESCR